MLHINSSEETVSASPEKVYQVLTHFFERRMDEMPGVTNWESLPNGCKFTVQNSIDCQLTITDQTPYSSVSYRAESDKGISADVVFDIRPQGAESLLQGHLDLNVPFFLQGMVRGVIDRFMGTAMEFLKKAIENS